MTVGFLWPALLAAVVVVPALAAWYLWLQRRGAVHPVAYPDVQVVLAAMARAGRVRRYVAAGGLFAGLVLIVLAVARPTFPLPVPADRSAIVLVMDISGSMRSTDIEPTRMEAAKAAAKAFLDDVPDRVRVGLVSFGGYATLVAPPGTDHAVIRQRIDEFTFIRRTAIGEGIIEGLAALPGRVRPGPDGVLPPLPAGSRPPGVLIVLSDGRSNSGIDAVKAAEMARAQEVVVHTIGVGNTNPSLGAWTIGGPLDESELRAVAQAGGGTYYHASSARALSDIYRRLARHVGWERRPDEVSAVFALGGAVALIVAIAASRFVTFPLDL